MKPLTSESPEGHAATGQTGEAERLAGKHLDIAIGQLRVALDQLTRAIAEIEPGAVRPEPAPRRLAADAALFVVQGNGAPRAPLRRRPSHRR